MKSCIRKIGQSFNAFVPPCPPRRVFLSKINNLGSDPIKPLAKHIHSYKIELAHVLGEIVKSL